jgi:VIT1/CCC1 family predicted Fe2+/Mn2+ transporter
MTDEPADIGAGSLIRRARPVRPFRITVARRPSDSAEDAAEIESRIADVAKGGARAAVLGVNDGLVTNVCLILAVAGANASASSVRLAGFASLVAGALSMAAGEWVSVRSQVELYQGLLAEVQVLVARNPKFILNELSSKLEEAGFGRETAQTAAAELPLDETRFLDFTARTIFGINPSELGSPMNAGLTSLTYFAGGALVPLAPWFFIGGTRAIAISISLTALAGLFVGGVVARLSERPVVRGAARQLAIVVAAAAATYGIGHLFGAAVH